MPKCVGRRRGRWSGLEDLERRVLLSSGYAFTAVTSLTSGIGGGATATSLLPDVSGNLYGTTTSGGLLNYGTIFEIPVGTDQVRTIASFDATTGFTPEGRIYMDGGGDLFGTTANGGTYNHGTIWELAAGAGQITTLWSFVGGSNGAYPVTGIAPDGSGNLWGTTYGDSADLGTVFKYAIASGTLTTVGTFAGGVLSVSTLATDPQGFLAMDGGNIFGAASNGGSGNSGFLFELSSTATPGTAIMSLTNGSFNVNSITGTQPIGSLLMLQDATAGNVLVGITSAGGTDSEGTMFEAAVSGSTATITQLASFIGTNGARPLGSLVAIAGGSGFYTIYGVTAQSSNNNYGEVYVANMTLTGATTDTAVIAALPGTTTPALAFSTTTGTRPSGGLYLAFGPVLYVTMSTDGAFQDGSVVQLVNGAVAPADHFVISQQPTSATAGATLGPITIKALKANGAVDTSFTGNVTLSLLTGTAGVTLNGPTAVAAVAGVASFPTGLSINQAGVFSWMASDGFAVTAAQSQRLTINPGKAAQLVVTQQPTAAGAGSLIGPIIVNVEDALGNIVTSDMSAVTLTIQSGPAGGKISGATAVAFKGVATLKTGSLSVAGAYTLRATDGKLPVVILALVTVGAPATTLAITAPAAKAFTSFEVDVLVTDALSNPAAVGSTVTLTVTQKTGRGPVLGLFTAIVGNDGVARFILWTAATGTYNLRATDGKPTSPLTLLTVTT